MKYTIAQKQRSYDALVTIKNNILGLIIEKYMWGK